MSKTTDTTKPRELTDDHRPLADSELDAVTGGIIPGGMLAEAMNITHILTAAVDFPAQLRTDKTKFIAWPEFIQFPAEDKLIGRPTLIVDDVWGSGRTITAADWFDMGCVSPTVSKRNNWRKRGAEH